MLKKPGSISLLLAIPLFFAACSTVEQGARNELNRMSIQFTEAAFVDSARQGDNKAVKLFLVADMKPDVTDTDGRRALVAAALGGHETVVCQLIEAGADVDAKTKEGQTALMGAAVNGNSRVVNILLSRGADVNLKDGYEFTALMYADGAGKSEVRELLVKAGARDGQPGPRQTPPSRSSLQRKQAEKS